MSSLRFTDDIILYQNACTAQHLAGVDDEIPKSVPGCQEFPDYHAHKT